ncbi:hypothetical protein [Gordonia neofelifaecis]|uniref:hypothetical protein n=1 Tax=Gordonia neofelifaecis TaxID=945692 RepID=UPI0002ECFE2F|nr:hypothetical protein [Gordonia neofelifaecis]
MPLRHLLRTAFVVFAALITALPFVAAPAHAAPVDAVPRAQIQAGASDVSVRVFNATVAAEPGYLVIRNRAGAEIERFPLAFIAPDDRSYPIDASVSGNVARLTPSTDAARSTSTDAVLVDQGFGTDSNGFKSKWERDDAALSRLTKEVTTGATVSTVIGAALGAVLGGLAGCFVLAATGPLGCFFAGVPLGAAAGAGLGIIISGGVAGAAVIHYFDTINRPFKTVPTTTSTSSTASSSSTRSSTASAPTTKRTPAAASASSKPAPSETSSRSAARSTSSVPVLPLPVVR